MKDKQTFVQNLVRSMTLEEKVGQCIVVGMSGTVPTNDLREAITRYHCGGIRLSPFVRIFRYFSDSRAKSIDMGPGFIPSMQKMAHQGPAPYLSPEEYAEMLNGLRELAANRRVPIPLHMVVDQEGDASKDYTRGGVVQFPSSMGLVAGGDPELAYDVARAVARQLKAAGLDMIHSPVVDVNINPQNPEIGNRAFSDDPEVVAEYAEAMVRGFKEEGVIAAAKHFPGRGDSAVDAHHDCPTLDVDRSRLENIELLPYKRLIEADVDSIMIAHCIYPQLDPDNISSVSRKIITGLLREEMGFKGLITTDSMTMGALIDKFGTAEACARSLAAGSDVILMKAENKWRGEMFELCTRWVKEGRIPETEIDAKVERILSLKYDYGLFEKMGKVNPAQAAEPFRDSFVVDTAEKAAQNAILIAKDELKALPLNRSKKVLLINQLNSIKTPNDKFDHPSMFQELMEEGWPELETLETDFGHNDADETTVLNWVKANKYDLILCTNFYDRSHKALKYPRALIEQGLPVVLITNTPYSIQGLGGMIPEAPSIVLDMNLSPQGLRMLRDVLLGTRNPKGSWPISNYNPLRLPIVQAKTQRAQVAEVAR